MSELAITLAILSCWMTYEAYNTQAYWWQVITGLLGLALVVAAFVVGIMGVA